MFAWREENGEANQHLEFMLGSSTRGLSTVQCLRRWCAHFIGLQQQCRGKAEDRGRLAKVYLTTKSFMIPKTRHF